MLMKNLFITILLALFMVSFSMPTKYVHVVILMDDGEDKVVVTTIYTTLMAAEKVAKMMDVEMIASDDPVQDDIFVFAIKTDAQKDLTMKLFDEEGYEVNAHRELSINQGDNYRALNVESVSDGTYIFQLTDETGAELSKTITIKKQ